MIKIFIWELHVDVQMIQWKEFSQQPLLRIWVCNTVLPIIFFCKFENKDTIFQEEEFSEMLN